VWAAAWGFLFLFDPLEDTAISETNVIYQFPQTPQQSLITVAPMMTVTHSHISFNGWWCRSMVTAPMN